MKIKPLNAFKILRQNSATTASFKIIVLSIFIFAFAPDLKAQSGKLVETNSPKDTWEKISGNKNSSVIYGGDKSFSSASGQVVAWNKIKI